MTKTFVFDGCIHGRDVSSCNFRVACEKELGEAIIKLFSVKPDHLVGGHICEGPPGRGCEHVVPSAYHVRP